MAMTGENARVCEGASFRRVMATPAGFPRALLGVFLSGLLLAACVHYEPLPLAPADSAASYSQRSLNSQSLRDAVAALLGADAQTWPPAQWDRARLLAVAIARNPDLAVLRANIDVTLAGQERARELPNPDMTLQSEYSRGERYTWLYGVGLDFLLLSPRQRRLNLSLARRASATAKWQLGERTWQVRNALITALSDWETVRRREPLLTSLLTAQQRLVDLQKRRVEAGEDPPSELAVSRVGLLQVEQRTSVVMRFAASSRSSKPLPTLRQDRDGRVAGGRGRLVPRPARKERHDLLTRVPGRCEAKHRVGSGAQRGAHGSRHRTMVGSLERTDATAPDPAHLT
jgi:Outer membrane efflux protein